MKFTYGLLLATMLVAMWRVVPKDRIQINLKVEPRSVAAGQQTLLTWEVKNADEIFISGIGRVNAQGRQQVSPL